MKKNKFSMYFLALLSAGMMASSCNDDDDNNNKAQEDFDAKIEALALTPKWNNYLQAASEELYEDCVKLYAAWAGPTALSDEEKEIADAAFFTELQAPDGYAALVKDPESAEFGSATAAVEQTLVQGSIDIAGEVGEQKIGGPNALAKDGKITQAVLEVESWYSFNSLDDYANNIISIRNSYFGGRDTTSAQSNSLSAFVADEDAELNTRLAAAIDNAHRAIRAMDAPFRNNLTGSKVDAAIDACADLAEIFERELIPFVRDHNDEAAYTAILQKYADDIVVATYRDMKEKAKALRDAVRTYVSEPKNQNHLDAAANAWRETRIPWEQSESFLYGPADKLSLDPSLDSWPLDQSDIYTILSDNEESVSDIRSEIGEEGVRGFHTIELLLFKDGNPRKVNE
jgi:predicted lipoprotein